jgi:hypothetical protein
VAGALICAVDPDPSAAERAAALTVGFYAVVRTYEGMFSEHGFAARLPAIRQAFLAADPDRMAEAVGHDMTHTFAAAGTAADVRERARAWEGLADRLWATPPHHARAPAEIARSQAGILEAFGVGG